MVRTYPHHATGTRVCNTEPAPPDIQVDETVWTGTTMQIPSTMTSHVRAANTALINALHAKNRDVMRSHLEAAAGALHLALTSKGMDPLLGRDARRNLTSAWTSVVAADGTSRTTATESIRHALFATDLMLPGASRLLP